MTTMHVAPRGYRPAASRRPRGPMTPITGKRYGNTLIGNGQRGERRELWGATSVDGVWSYDRQDEQGTPWTVTYTPTGQFREFYGSLPAAREATARQMTIHGVTLPELVVELRHVAGLAAYDQGDAGRRLAGQRWLAVHMRLAGAVDAEARCECGGLLATVNEAGDLYAHVDAGVECFTYGQPGSGPCPDDCEHVVCADPRPVQCDHARFNGCRADAKPTRGHGCPIAGGECCLVCCSGE